MKTTNVEDTKREKARKLRYKKPIVRNLNHNYNFCFYSHFGKRVFLTKDEAEQAIKKMESEECHGCMDGGNKR